MIEVTVAGLVVEDDNASLSENLITNDGDVEYKYEEWDHSGICYQHEHMPIFPIQPLKLQPNKSADSFNCLALFEHIFIIDFAHLLLPFVMIFVCLSVQGDILFTSFLQDF